MAFFFFSPVSKDRGVPEPSVLILPTAVLNFRDGVPFLTISLAVLSFVVQKLFSQLLVL